MGALTQLTPLGTAALALLTERPMHPYEMYQLLIQRREDRLLKVRPGSLYHTVDRLARHELVRAVGTEREGNRPERTSYEITEAGRANLEKRISGILETPVNEYPEFPFAISEAHNLPAETVAELLRSRLLQLRAEVDTLDEARRDVEKKSLPRVYWLEVSYQRAMFQAEIDWIEQLVAEIDTGAIPWMHSAAHPSAQLVESAN